MQLSARSISGYAVEFTKHFRFYMLTMPIHMPEVKFIEMANTATAPAQHAMVCR